MTDDILVTVKGTQFFFNETDAGDDAVEIVTPGRYRVQDGTHFISYEEVYEGIEGTTHNEIRVFGSAVEVVKSGLVNAGMYFEEGKRGMSYYTTPFGQMEMGIATTELKKNVTGDRIDLRIGYALEVNGAHIADCKVSICAQSNS